MVNFGLSGTVANLRMLPEYSPVVPRNVGFRYVSLFLEGTNHSV